MFLNAPAKLNLTLKILSKRADGYHEISSLMRGIRLFDEVEITAAPEDGRSLIQVHVHADTQDVPEGPENLAYRAAQTVLARAQADTAGSPFAAPQPSVSITLKKNIPVAAGLAGGSSDAAAVLLGLSKLLLPETELSEIAARGAALGADIPFCVYACAAANPALGHTGAAGAHATGIGERLELLSGAALTPAFVLLVKPALSVSTREIYAGYDALAEQREHETGGLAGASDGGSAGAPEKGLREACVADGGSTGAPEKGLREACVADGGSAGAPEKGLREACVADGLEGELTFRSGAWYTPAGTDSREPGGETENETMYEPENDLEPVCVADGLEGELTFRSGAWYTPAGMDSREPGGETENETMYEPENDLEPACVAAYPVVAETLAALKALCKAEGIRARVQLSGSGPTVFAYFEEADCDFDAASRLYTRARAAFPQMRVLLTEAL